MSIKFEKGGQEDMTHTNTIVKCNVNTHFLKASQMAREAIPYVNTTIYNTYHLSDKQQPTYIGDIDKFILCNK